MTGAAICEVCQVLTLTSTAILRGLPGMDACKKRRKLDPANFGYIFSLTCTRKSTFWGRLNFYWNSGFWACAAGCVENGRVCRVWTPLSYKGALAQWCFFHIRVPLHRGAPFMWGALTHGCPFIWGPLTHGCPFHIRVPLHTGAPFI